MLKTTIRRLRLPLCAVCLAVLPAFGCVPADADDDSGGSNGGTEDASPRTSDDAGRDAGGIARDTRSPSEDATEDDEDTEEATDTRTTRDTEPSDEDTRTADTDPGLDTRPPEDTRSADTRMGEDVAEDTMPFSPDTGPDAGPSGDTSTDAGPRACRSSTPKQATKLTKMNNLTWLVSNLPRRNNSIVDSAKDGSFRLPKDGQQKYGAKWTAKQPDKNGKIAGGQNFRGARYAAISLTRFSSDVIVANPEGVQRIYVNGFPQAGDVYAHGDKRVPLQLTPGTNRIVLQFSAARGAKIELFKTPDPVVFNEKDKTTPELRVGSKTTQPVGLPVLNTTGRALRDVEAKVVGNQHVEATTVDYPALAPNAVTQIGFKLKPKDKWATSGKKIPVTLRLEACSLDEAIETTLELKTVKRGSTFRRTFRSPIDGSVQYYAVVPPKNYSSTKTYGLALALHGASVEAEGHATAYSRKKDMYIVAPTNRRKYGFDWEEWGRLNGLASLDHAMQTFDIDERRVYVTGHSMGGHGTWHFGVMDPDRFATVGPSAGWASFYTYAGSDRPQSPILKSSRAHSSTNDYLSNLADRGAYIVHGAKDNNVPTQEGRDLRDALRKEVNKGVEVKYHEEPGADHWWDGNRADGTDCVDWPPLFKYFRNHELPKQPELDFEFKSPGPYYSPTYDYVTIRARNNPLRDATLDSEKTGSSTVTLTTTNVKSMDIDGAALQSRGITTLKVDGQTKSVPQSTFRVGPKTAKHPGQTGPLNQVFQRPFCFVYAKNGPDVYKKYAALLLSIWSIRGNGHGCAMPMSWVTPKLRQERNLIYLGVDTSKIQGAGSAPFSWNGQKLTLGSWTFNKGVSYVAFPQGDHMAASINATSSDTHLLSTFHPFSSRSGMPDYLVLGDVGGLALGFFDANWKFDSGLGGRR